jgi:hypothetical protein
MFSRIVRAPILFFDSNPMEKKIEGRRGGHSQIVQ